MGHFLPNYPTQSSFQERIRSHHRRKERPMYPPQLLATYSDGRRAYQFAAPPKLDDVKIEVYYYFSVDDVASGNADRVIVYIVKDNFDIEYNKLGKTTFFITDKNGILPKCVYEDGGCLSVDRELTPQEVDSEGRIFKSALGFL